LSADIFKKDVIFLKSFIRCYLRFKIDLEAKKPSVFLNHLEKNLSSLYLIFFRLLFAKD